MFSDLLYCIAIGWISGSLSRSRKFRARLEEKDDITEFDNKIQQLSTQDEEIDDSFAMEHPSMGNLSCLSCQPPNCDHRKICHNAVKCYTIHVRDTDGYEQKSKGMLHIPFFIILYCISL